MGSKNRLRALHCMVFICVFFFAPFCVFADDTVCAKVKIEIQQELTLERQAFDAHMRINNGLPHITLENIDIDVSFKDADGNSVLASSDPDNTDALFFIRIDSMDNISNVDGSGTVLPSTSANIHWLIIPAIGASNGQSDGTLYFVGATLTYTIGGEENVTEVSPDFIFVKPMPELTLDYFLPVDVYGDDAFTTEVEPSIPFNLGVRVKNSGAGVARSLKIDSAQPRIIENEQGLLINFVIQGSEVNGREITPSLLADFGDIAPNSAGVARWIMTCSLSGQFTAFNATYTHSDDLGGQLTSLIDTVNTHFLVHDVLVDLPGRDSIRDFLALDGGTYRVYESDLTDTIVTNLSTNANLQVISSEDNETHYQLNASIAEGFVYIQLGDPEGNEKRIKRVVRSDGKYINAENYWLSKTRGQDHIWQYFVNLFDVDTSGAYTIVYEDLTAAPQPPVLQFIPDRASIEGSQVAFVVQAIDPNGTIPILSAQFLPPGASFIDLKNGTGVFEWTPALGQAGLYEINFKASDGLLTDYQYVRIKICTADDSDCDGMDDQWEQDNFDTLDRNGTGDYDNDGVSDLDEFLEGTDPSGSLTITLNQGYNMIAVIGDPAEEVTMGAWFDLLGGESVIEKLEVFDPVTGTFMIFSATDTTHQSEILNIGGGVIAYAIETQDIDFDTHVCGDIDLQNGFNLTGIPCPPDWYTAFGLLTALGNEDVISIQRYDAAIGRFESAAFNENGQPTGVDFSIVDGEGYMVNMRNSVTQFVP